MNKRFYARLALQNLGKNGKFYKPYLLTVMGAVAAVYMISSTTEPQGVASLFPFSVLTIILNMGVAVVAIVGGLFLLYTNSFLMKQRGREFGLYCILGMSKRNITRTLLWETVYIALAGIGGGLVIGGVFNKLLLLLLCRLVGVELAGPVFYGGAALRAAGVFMILLLLIFLINSGRIHLSQPIALLQSKSAGEREPKARWLLALLGLLTLGGGYYISITTTSPLAAMFLFLVAVLLVIAGTFLLFLAGSVTVLKLLRRRKRYYYKTRHFIAVSGLMYRMKRNAAGLAIICIMSTAILIMLSSTVGLYMGIEDRINLSFPRQIMSYCASNDTETWSLDEDGTIAYLEEQGFHPENVQTYTLLSASALLTEEGLSCDVSAAETDWDAGNYQSYLNRLRALYILTAEGYETLTGQAVTLEPGELMLYNYGEAGGAVNIFGQVFSVAGELPESDTTRRFEREFSTVEVVVIVAAEEDFQTLYGLQKQGYGDYASMVEFHLDFDLPDGEDLSAASDAVLFAFTAQRDFSMEISIFTGYALDDDEGLEVEFDVDNREDSRQNAKELYGGLLYLGLFLGVLFLLGTVLIIYYKQLSEGYEDQGRYAIMQKVGMSRPEIAGAIRSQMLLVFFLPLGTAVLHVAAAAPCVLRLMKLLAMSNTDLFFICTAVSVGIFALIYTAVYAVTAKTYYGIVSRSGA